MPDTPSVGRIRIEIKGCRKMITHYICKDCGAVWTESEFGAIISSPSDGSLCCPECHSLDWEEAVKCPECGGWYAENDTYHDYCENCIKELSSPESTISYCEEVGEKQDIEVNYAVVNLLDSLGVDINKLLMSYALKKAKTLEYREHLEACAEIDVKVELDTADFMKYEHQRRSMERKITA